MDHTDDCMGGTDCTAIDGSWNIPQGIYVDQAKGDLGDDAPWCRIRELAWEYQEAND